VAADDETKKEDNRTDHPGIDSARKAAKAIGGFVAYPSRGDFNDVFVNAGPEKVAEEIAAAQESPEEVEPTVLHAQFGPVDEVPKEIENINREYALVLAGNKASIMKLEESAKFRLIQVGAFKQWFANR